MIHPIPPGTRDVLPDEMRELRRLSRALIEVFEARGYGEVATPTIEYDEVLARGDGRAADSAYRFFDESGDLLALRSDMTVPIARLVASRFADAEPPLRLCYLASAYRAVRPQRGQMREFVQAGVELIGAPAPRGHRRGDRGAGGGARRRRPRPRRDRPRRRRPLPPAADRVRGRGRGARLDPRPPRDARPGRPRGRALRGRRDRRRAGRDLRRALAAARRQRGARARRARSAAPRSSGRPRGCRRPSRRWSARGVADRVQIDLGLLRDLGYYSGAILEVYDPALGHVLGGGGRYDGLLKRFGVDLPAAGFALYLERVHVAQMEEESRRGRARR